MQTLKFILFINTAAQPAPQLRALVILNILDAKIRHSFVILNRL